MNYDLFAFPTTNNPFFNDSRCFSVPVINFSLTNPNDIEMMINGIDIEASVINTQTVSVGAGQMIAGADFMTYECVISTNRPCLFTAKFKSKNSDYLKLSSRELAAVRIYVRSATPGLYRIRPICNYSIGRQSKSMTEGDFFDAIYFLMINTSCIRLNRDFSYFSFSIAIINLFIASLIVYLDPAQRV